MRPNVTTPEALSDNLLADISINTGINNFSATSKVRNITDSVAEELNLLADNINVITNNIFTETATEDYLDANGSEWAVYRRRIPNIILRSEDQVGYLRPINKELGFSEMLFGKTIVDAGTTINVGGKYNIAFLEDAVLQANDTEIPVSIRVNVSDPNDTVNIAQDSQFRLDVTFNPLLSNVQLDFDKPVIIGSQVEADIDFRQRIILEKNTSRTASENAVRAAIMSMPNVVGYRFDQIGAGVNNVHIITNDLLQLGADNDMDDSLLLLKQLLRERGSAGGVFNVYVPKALYFQADISFDDTVVDELTAKNAVIKVMKDNYRYNNNALVLIDSINYLLKSLIGVDDAIIVSRIRAYDAQADLIVSESDVSMNIPAYGFLFFNREGIEIESV